MHRTTILVILLLFVIALAVGDRIVHREGHSPRKPSLNVVKENGPVELHKLQKRRGPKKYSQYNEEIIIRELLDDMREGVFVDVGAYHYKRFSNTYYLEKHLGWTGIAIDALEKYKEGYLQYRPGTKFFSFYVSDESDGDAPFYIVVERDNQSTGNKVSAVSKKRRFRKLLSPQSR